MIGLQKKMMTSIEQEKNPKTAQRVIITHDQTSPEAKNAEGMYKIVPPIVEMIIVNKLPKCEPGLENERNKSKETPLDPCLEQDGIKWFESTPLIVPFRSGINACPW